MPTTRYVFVVPIAGFLLIVRLTQRIVYPPTLCARARACCSCHAGHLAGPVGPCARRLAPAGTRGSRSGDVDGRLHPVLPVPGLVAPEQEDAAVVERVGELG